MKPVFTLILLSLLFSCRKTPDTIPLPTKICVQSTHHLIPIAGVKIQLKYFSDTFPGYDKNPAFYDAVFVTDHDGNGCLSSIPEGDHWLVAVGFDSVFHHQAVYGSLPIHISLDKHPVLDTILYLSE